MSVKRHILLVPVVLMLGVLVLSGCTYHINARLPEKPEIVTPRLPARVAVIIPDEEARRRQPLSGMFFIGMAHTWMLETGEALTNYSKLYFPAIFSGVSFYRDRNDAQSDASNYLFIEPRLYDIYITQSFSTTLTLKSTVTDRNKNVVYERSVGGQNQKNGAFWKACLGGVFTGESALEDTFSDAMENAFNQLATDMKGQLQVKP